jgi:hypothetical protein
MVALQMMVVIKQRWRIFTRADERQSISHTFG